jgi:hypothetical protein
MVITYIMNKMMGLFEAKQFLKPTEVKIITFTK